MVNRTQNINISINTNTASTLTPNASLNETLTPPRVGRLSSESHSPMNDATVHSTNYLNYTSQNQENALSKEQENFNKGFIDGVSKVTKIFNSESKISKSEFEQLLTDLGKLRNEIAQKNAAAKASEFGLLREFSDCEENRCSTVLGHVEDGNPYNEHIPDIKKFAEENGHYHNDNSYYYYHSVTKMLDEDDSTSTVKNVIQLTLIQSIPETQSFPGDLGLEHTSPSMLQDCIQNLYIIFKNIKNSILGKDIDGAVLNIAEFTYLFNHTTPYYRGSASIGEIFTAGMLAAVGIKPNIYFFKGMDGLAFSNTLETFIPAFKDKLGLN